MTIKLKRVYEQPSPSDGYRVLVDRLWPRGLTKEKAQLDEWAKDIAPSHELRKWFHADRTKWAEFKSKYIAELSERREQLGQMLVKAGRRPLTLLYASQDTERNHAIVLAEFLKKSKA
jgi:uncharacterized protein YeaO (DUF488 family)